MQKRYKYSRTFSLPWSPHNQKDGELTTNLSDFKNKKVIVQTKMDGENFSLYPDGLHARSIDSKHHDSRSWIKAKHAEVRGYIPNNFRICGENMYAQHSIRYEELESFFYIFSIWNEDVCLGWEYTQQWADYFKFPTPKILWTGLFDEGRIRYITNNITDDMEGIVVRNIGTFKYKDFHKNVTKWVRPNHVQTDIHWTKNWVPNKLKE